mmetsp:Transcript_48828/g.104680  ORF Transcript_48828/g.104680 Transcript_48828/m.104680 type:complete len:103 (-) Transcript_48828:231-539(-)
MREEARSCAQIHMIDGETCCFCTGQFVNRSASRVQCRGRVAQRAWVTCLPSRTPGTLLFEVNLVTRKLAELKNNELCGRGLPKRFKGLSAVLKRTYGTQRGV